MSRRKSRVEQVQLPSFIANPVLTGAAELGLETGRGLLTGQFFEPGQALGFLSPLVSLNPEATQAAVGLATRGITEARDRAQQSIINQLEANNQLTSSVSVNRLSDLNQSFAQDIADVNTQFFLADVERSLGNIAGLFGLGADLTIQSGQLGAQRESNQNQFSIQRAELALNQAAAIDSQRRGGFGGALTGALGGALAGAPFGPAGLAIGALGGGLAGGFGQQGTGGQFLSAGGTALGAIAGEKFGGGSGFGFGSLNPFRRVGDSGGLGQPRLADTFGFNDLRTTALSRFGGGLQKSPFDIPKLVGSV